MSATLIYTVAIGAPYRALAGLLVRSLRRHGFAGELAVICDGPIECPPGLATLYPVTADRLRLLDMAGPNAVYLRTVADQIIPRFFRNEYLLHVDADVLCTAALGPFLAVEPRQVRVQQYPRPLCTAAQDFTAHDLRRVQLRQLAGHDPFAACAGIVGFPGGRAGRDFLRLWSFEAAGRRGNDQTALNVVLHRAFPGNHGYLPGCTFWPDTSGYLCHFLGHKEEMPRRNTEC